MLVFAQHIYIFTEFTHRALARMEKNSAFYLNRETKFNWGFEDIVSPSVEYQGAKSLEHLQYLA